MNSTTHAIVDETAGSGFDSVTDDELIADDLDQAAAPPARSGDLACQGLAVRLPGEQAGDRVIAACTTGPQQPGPLAGELFHNRQEVAFVMRELARDGLLITDHAGTYLAA